jgi:hypothetical protein
MLAFAPYDSSILPQNKDTTFAPPIFLKFFYASTMLSDFAPKQLTHKQRHQQISPSRSFAWLDIITDRFFADQPNCQKRRNGQKILEHVDETSSRTQNPGIRSRLLDCRYPLPLELSLEGTLAALVGLSAERRASVSNNDTSRSESSGANLETVITAIPQEDHAAQMAADDVKSTDTNVCVDETE